MSEPRVYDIAVIGGGLAGLCLAIQSANAGYSTILFEKEEYPFHKVCGEYISMESWDFLLRLGVPLQEWDLPVMKRFQATDVSGRMYNFNLPLGGFGVSRFKLDHFLYELARQKGVIVHTKTKVTNTLLSDGVVEVYAGERMYHANAVAGSFGKRSNLDVKWNRSFLQSGDRLSNFVGVKYHIRYPHAHDAIALHNFHNGYCGISKVEDDISCLCYLTTAANLKENGNSIMQMEEEVLHRNPCLKKIFKTAAFLYAKPLTISQVSFATKTQVQNNLLMLGDAAGMITPLCGNGMSMAMHGSLIAFGWINTFLQGRITRQQMEKEYSTNWSVVFARRLQTGRMVQQLFGGNLSTAVFLKLMSAFPAVANKVIRTTHGKPF